MTLKLACVFAMLGVLVVNLCLVGAARILMIPVGAGRPSSHRFVMEKAAMVLQNGGHNITWLLGNEYSSGKFGTSITYQSRPDSFTNADDLISDGRVGLSYILNILNQFVDACTKLLGNNELVEELKNEDFDLLFLDAADLCGFAMVEKLGTPYAVIVSTGTAGVLYSEAPPMLSFSPSLILPYTSRMNFFQRVHNTVVYVFFRVFGHITFVRRLENTAKRMGYLSQHRSIEDAARRANMYFVVGDFSFDYPIPVMPNVKHIGVITATEPEPLEKSLEEFIQRSGNYGVVLISFGSAIGAGSADVVKKIAAAIDGLPYFFIWKTDTENSPKVGDNVKFVDWLPQNDLLANPKMALFITHAGPNSVWEGVYHGIPMLALPIVADEYGNAARIVHHGVGKQLDYYSFTSDELRAAILECIENKTYVERAEYKSRHLRSNKLTSSEGFLWWTNHLLETKGAYYLQSASVDLNFYQYYLLDVMALFFIVGFLFLILLVRLIKVVTCIMLKVFHKKSKVE